MGGRPLLSRSALGAYAVAHLRERGVRVASPMSSARPESLHEVPPASFGALLADVHSAFDDDFDVAGAEAWAIDIDALTGATDRWLRRTYADLPDESAVLVRWREAARSAIAAVPMADEGMCHGEAYPATCRMEADGLAVAELDWVGAGARIYDLATYRWVLALHLPDEGESMFADFVTGYRSRRPAPDLSALDGWVAARHLWSLRLAAGFAPTKQLSRRAALAATWPIAVAAQ